MPSEDMNLAQRVAAARAVALHGKRVDRQSLENATRIIESCIPAAARGFVAALVAKSIRTAVEVKPSSWTVTLYDNGFRLNVGVIYAIDVIEDHVSVVVNSLDLSPDARASLAERFGELGWPSVPEAGNVCLFFDEIERLWALVDDAHTGLLRRLAGQVKTRIATYRAHSPGVLAWLRGQGLEVPDAVAAEDRTSEGALAPSPGPACWWVCQGDNYNRERDGGYIWAPTQNAKGQPQRFWDTLQEVAPGDILVHYAQGAVRAIGQARSVSYAATRGEPATSGRKIDVEYHELESPLPLEKFVRELDALRIDDGPVVAGPVIRQAYLCRFSAGGLGVLRDKVRDWPPWAEGLVGPSGLPSLSALLSHLRAASLHFSDELVSTYLLALAAKRFVLLTGLSGTGKTQLAKAVAAYLGGGEAPTTSGLDADDGIRITVAPYMLRHHKLVMTRALLEELRAFPPTPELDVEFPAGKTKLKLYMPTREGGVPDLGFRGPFREWFESAVHEGDTLRIRVEGEDTPVLRFENLTTMGREPEPPRYKIVAVRPDWTDPRSLLGYFNALLGRYQVTPVLRFILDAAEDARRKGSSARPYFLILDEMNLAHVEHYFSDFLSALESGEAIDLHTERSVEEVNEDGPVPRKLLLPPNLYVVGTVNIDETTYMFSPKVLDRAFTLELVEVDLRGYGAAQGVVTGDRLLALTTLPDLTDTSSPDKSDWQAFCQLAGGELNRRLLTLHDELKKSNRHFGYRVANEIACFVRLASDHGAKDLWTAFDVALMTKVLPKLHGTRQELDPVLKAIDEVAARTETLPELPRTAGKIRRMQQRLAREGFASFIE